MKTVLYSVASVLAACVVAIAGYFLMVPKSFLQLDKAWSYSQYTGGENANPYIRAHVARTGLLALNQSEAIYFVANFDSDGEKLSSKCVYKVVGGELPAKWWSITLYGDDNFLVPSPQKLYAVSNAMQKDVNFSIAPTEKTGLWLPTPSKGGFNLLLRLYQPSEKDVSKLKLPKIMKGGCAS